jgi:hypothetical protein
MTKRNFEQSRARQRGRDAARDDPEFALMRSAGSHVERGKLRRVACTCGRVRYVLITESETRRRAKCVACGTVIAL